MYIHSHSLRSHGPRALARATSRTPGRAPSLRQALLLVLALLLAFGVSTLAAESAAPMIEGRLDDAAWAAGRAAGTWCR